LHALRTRVFVSDVESARQPRADTEKTELKSLPLLGDLVGESAPMRALRREVAEVAPLRSTVLLTGETGVGKG
jgi:DNA-binding NtrC family response regulator